jgi:hypothetical protein
MHLRRSLNQDSDPDASIATTKPNSNASTRSPSYISFFPSPSVSPKLKTTKPSSTFLPKLNLASASPVVSPLISKRQLAVSKQSGSLAARPGKPPLSLLKSKMFFVAIMKSVADIEDEIKESLTASRCAQIKIIQSKKKTLKSVRGIYELHLKFYYAECEDRFLSVKARRAVTNDRLKKLEEANYRIRSLTGEIQLAEQELTELNAKLFVKEQPKESLPPEGLPQITLRYK